MVVVCHDAFPSSYGGWEAKTILKKILSPTEARNILIAGGHCREPLWPGAPHMTVHSSQYHKEPWQHWGWFQYPFTYGTLCDYVMHLMVRQALLWADYIIPKEELFIWPCFHSILHEGKVWPPLETGTFQLCFDILPLHLLCLRYSSEGKEKYFLLWCACGD